MKFLMVVLLLISSGAYAKHFIKQKFIFEMTHETLYKSVKIAHQKTIARYADDGSFCELEIKEVKISCLGNNGDTYWIGDNRELFLQIGIDSSIIDQMTPQPQNISLHLQYGVFQIHTNDKAESYHLKIVPRAEKRVD